jgi:hypothetical protein
MNMCGLLLNDQRLKSKSGIHIGWMYNVILVFVNNNEGI